MNKPTVFTGAATALITPLTPDGIDFDRYGAMIDWQIEAGIDAIVAVGTTGEGSTLSDEEHRAAIKYCVERVNHRVPVIAGTGSNDTAYSVDLSRYAASVGADMISVSSHKIEGPKGVGALVVDRRIFKDRGLSPIIPHWVSKMAVSSVRVMTNPWIVCAMLRPMAVS